MSTSSGKSGFCTVDECKHANNEYKYAKGLSSPAVLKDRLKFMYNRPLKPLVRAQVIQP